MFLSQSPAGTLPDLPGDRGPARAAACSSSCKIPCASSRRGPRTVSGRDCHNACRLDGGSRPCRRHRHPATRRPLVSSVRASRSSTSPRRSTRRLISPLDVRRIRLTDGSIRPACAAAASGRAVDRQHYLAAQVDQTVHDIRGQRHGGRGHRAANSFLDVIHDRCRNASGRRKTCCTVRIWLIARSPLIGSTGQGNAAGLGQFPQVEDIDHASQDDGAPADAALSLAGVQLLCGCRDVHDLIDAQPHVTPADGVYHDRDLPALACRQGSRTIHAHQRHDAAAIGNNWLAGAQLDLRLPGNSSRRVTSGSGTATCRSRATRQTRYSSFPVRVDLLFRFSGLGSSRHLPLHARGPGHRPRVPTRPRPGST